MFQNTGRVDWQLVRKDEPLLPKDGMKGVLDVMRDVWISVFGESALNRHGMFETPRLQQVKSNDFDESAERSTRCLLRIFGVVKNLLD